jgi:hypothetical protein
VNIALYMDEHCSQSTSREQTASALQLDKVQSTVYGFQEGKTVKNPSSSGSGDRRKSVRKKPRGAVKVMCRQDPSGPSKSLPAQLLNISEGGLCIETPAALAPQEVVEISIQGPSQSKPMKCLANVCWLVPLQNGDFCAGLAFQKRLLFSEVLQITKPAAKSAPRSS